MKRPATEIELGRAAHETARDTIRDDNGAAEVITRLRGAFSKKVAATEFVDLNEATREVLALVSSDLLRKRVFLRTELDDDRTLLVTGDPIQLQQVILDLVRKASDAMRDVNDPCRHLLVKAERDQQGNVRLIVKDAGVGCRQSPRRILPPTATVWASAYLSPVIESDGGKLRPKKMTVRAPRFHLLSPDLPTELRVTALVTLVRQPR